MGGEFVAPTGVLAGLLDGAPVGVAFFDEDSRLRYANAVFLAAEKADGGEGRDGSLAGSLSRRIAGSAQRILRWSGESAESEVVSADDETPLPRTHLVRLFAVSVSRAVVGMSVLLGDATDRAALRASEQRFRAFMDNAPVLSTILDLDDRAAFLSAPALRALGVGVEAMGQRAEDLLPAGVRCPVPAVDPGRTRYRRGPNSRGSAPGQW
jgi:PAS domain-containing protein